jgi:hypothetical protein
MLLTPAQKRKNIGKLLASDRLGAWIVPFSEDGNIQPDRIQQLELRKKWFSRGGEKALGTLQIINHSSNQIVIPEQTLWWDRNGDSYKLTELGMVKPNTISFLGVEAVEFGSRDYHGFAQVSHWPDAENADVDWAQIEVLYAQTELCAGEAEDGEESASCFALDAVLKVEGGAYRGEGAVFFQQKKSIIWHFYAGESLAGFRVMTERMSGYVYHQVNIKPTLLFWKDESIQLGAGTVWLRFSGVEPEANQ